METAVEIITDWIEKNIDTIHYPEFDKETLKETGNMVFNRPFVLSHLSGVMPDVKKRLQSPKADVSRVVAIEALTAIAYPYDFLKKEAEKEGGKLDGRMTSDIINSASFYQQIAKDALEKI